MQISHCKYAGSVLLTVILAACGGAPTVPSPAVPSVPDPSVEARNQALVVQHTQIWQLMELSDAAQKELNGVVVAVNRQMAKNKEAHPEAFASAATVKRSGGKLTYDQYMANHKRRFDFLKLSEATQGELLAAATFVWRALHDRDVPEDKRKVAETIKNMMIQLEGPPPCCDDNIFERAKP
jgi:hypothetical protein